MIFAAIAVCLLVVIISGVGSEEPDSQSVDVTNVSSVSTTDTSNEISTTSVNDTTAISTTIISTTQQTTKATTAKITTTKAVAANPDAQVTVYITATGKKYHNENPCGNGTYHAISLAEAKKRI